MAFSKLTSRSGSSRSSNPTFARSASLTLVALACAQAFAQDAPQRVEPITVSARSAPVLEAESADVGGFDAPIAKTPQSVSVIGNDLLNALGIRTLSSALKLDASLADNYNAGGYIESLSVRGFVLDQTNNFKRNGLANSNYAPIAFENKERIEILKGAAGLQAGVAAPGGLINVVTKQPLRDAFTVVSLDADRWSNSKVHVDSNTRLGSAGLRVNVAAERIDNHWAGARGDRALASAAFALPLSRDTSLLIDLEHHRQSQPSVPGFGLLDRDGDGVAESLPEARKLWRTNLNNQPWSLPVVTRTTQATAKLSHRINADWNVQVGVHLFRTQIDDRIAFPDGCSSAANYVYPGLCGNGDVDIYDFRNDGERRQLTSFEAALQGKFNALSTEHRVRVALSGRDGAVRQPTLGAYNFAGTVNAFSPSVLAANPTLESVNTLSDERALELSASLRSLWSARLESFVGVRLAQVDRSSVNTDGSRAVSLSQTHATPFIAGVYNFNATQSAYAQFSQGVETESVPNRPSRFINAGAALPGAKSDQLELGWKWQANPRTLVTGAVFQIEKPYSDDRIEPSDARGRPLRIAAAKLARHRGVELSLTGRATDALSLQASATYLDARYTRALNSELIDQRVTNVPRFALSLFADYKVAAVRGLSINSLLYVQSGKTVDSFGQVSLPRALQIDLGASYQARLANRLTTARLTVENIADGAYWREAPTTSWGGQYLFASAPRNVKFSVSTEF